MVVYILGTDEKLAKRKSNVCVPSLMRTHIINHFMQTEEIAQRRCSYSNRKWAILRGLCCAFSACGG